MKRQYSIKKRGNGILFICALLLLLSGSLFVLFDNHTLGNMSLLNASAVRNPITSDNGAEAATDKVYKIMIDPGHGGKDPGTKGFSGNEEKDVNLSVALKVYELLQKDSRFAPRLTRTDDTFVELENRAAMANDWQADAFLSIHGNSYSDKSVSGTEAYYRHDSGLPLAQAVHGELLKAMGFKDRGVRVNELKVLSSSEMSAALIEIGYLTNPEEEAAILDEEGQERAAQAIVDGLKQYFAIR